MRRPFTLSFPPARAARLLALLLTALGLGACGNLTAGGLAETDVTVSGDAPDPAPAAAPSWAWLPPRANQDDDDDAEGELEAEFELYLENGAGSLVPLTTQPVIVDVDITGVVEQQATSAVVPAGRYTALHLVFSDVEVEIEGGLIVDGQLVLGLVEVELEADSLTVVKPVAVDLEEGERVEILVDFNSQIWLQAVDPILQVVAEDIFAEAVSVRVR